MTVLSCKVKQKADIKLLSSHDNSEKPLNQELCWALKLNFSIPQKPRNQITEIFIFRLSLPVLKDLENFSKE